MIKLLKQNGETTYGIKEYIVDTVEELNSIKSQNIMGSKAYVVNTNENYILSGSNEWILISKNSYDDSELRKLIQDNTDRITLLTDLSPEDLNTFLEVATALSDLNKKIDNIDTLNEEEIKTIITDEIKAIETLDENEVKALIANEVKVISNDDIDTLIGGDSQ